MEMTLSRYWWVLALRGVVAILFGLTAFFWPGLTLEALVLLFGAYALADGVFAVIAGVRNTGRQGRWWALLLEGVVGIIAGVLTFVWPGITALALVFVIASWALLTGVFEVAAAIRLRREIEGEWMLALSGVASIIFGLSLVVFPDSGALAIVWLIGAYALVFGVLMVGAGLQARGHNRPLDSATPRAA